MTLVRCGILLGLLSLASAGCRAPLPVIVPQLPPPTAPLPAPELPLVPAASLEPNYQTLPKIDAVKARQADLAPATIAYRGLTEAICRKEAAARAAGLDVLFQGPACDEVRQHLAQAARNRAAADALDDYFRLADAQGRGELLNVAVGVLDQLRTMVAKARADGVRVPIEPDDLDRQRAAVLALIVQAELGSRALDLELRRKLGVEPVAGERVRPVGPFPMTAEEPDLDSAVMAGLSNRADLRALRAAYHGLSPAMLPTVRELLKLPAVATAIPRPVRVALRNQPTGPDPAVMMEVELRRRQLYDLIAVRERQVADEVRVAAAGMLAETRQVGLAHWRAEQSTRKAVEAKDKGPIVELGAALEAYRARADVVAAVMAWHQARIKFLAAQGALAPE